jgi:hypothetical protein
MSRPFDLAGKSAVIVTMHGKGRVIESPLAGTGLRFLGCPAIDTDRFGTFTRDIARTGSQIEALLAKARAGLVEVPQADFALASEGAFGPHPQMPFLPAGLELVGLLDRQSGKAVIGRNLTINTNFAQAEARSCDEAEAFASRVGFPEHAVVVMEGRSGPIVAKAVSAAKAFRKIASSVIERVGSVWLEADMRACVNPTRMNAIALASKDLARRLHARCPGCGFPDWTPATIGGRPCAWCNRPTLEPWVEELVCDRCGHSDTRCLEPKRKADPGHCGFCNP